MATNVTVEGGMAFLPDGSVVNLLSIQQALNGAFQETGEMEFAHAANELSRITLKYQGPQGEFLDGSYYDSCSGIDHPLPESGSDGKEHISGDVADPLATALPTVIIEMDCGAIHCVRSSVAARVVLLDADTEGGDAERIMAVNGNEVYVHDFCLVTPEDVDPSFVTEVLEQIAEPGEPVLWTNHYRCPCGEEWEDQWESTCNDKCPACNKEIEPYISDDGSVSSETIEAARLTALATQGWFVCANCGAEVESIVGCPDGAEICQQCFDNGHH